MAFGVKRQELTEWKQNVLKGRVSFLTHFWYDPRFPEYKTVTKAACADRDILLAWGGKYGLKESWLHERESFPHFDLIGETEKRILRAEGCYEKLLQLENKAGIK
ncbi:hypothetical protein HXA34_11510 [Salipaludibacillus agaradhaerens]|jgi:hypothetical protein|uniref:Uncharacterized protein n=1 Tax=Salipaludibacillus agaradhaerens TaxID=76935 RepID=A0A9Q4FYJ2_SALAG|nr:hypothetical protein [Salipaludibacillus agaradhaerens]UJW58001.1 hypothetical protein HXZ66_11580 [Bacillus sp. A116_S68]MCR6096197.1 hypothetical protein [Salipaludibacillus agaradhaerens]MCR6106915.1 hypothetical protein [Salipaludibacillus agaradhaerens]MCR6114244.1 hypothetical protein [Salipaludibacillus agaradhaerens]MCR6118947.1 hypothetical protein [Salipaludibacillus agaradhaerens]